MTIRFLCGDALEQLRLLPDESVQCCITSPPYWGLRDYGIAGQLGLERTPEEYVGKLVKLFREVRRVLRGDGTLWLNLGDCYARLPSRGVKFQSGPSTYLTNQQANEGNRGPDVPLGLKEKDLVGIPWRVAFALQADGWWLRSDIIWSKPNPMPESVTDRPTKAHEYLFLLIKGQWKSRIVQFSDLSSERFHLGKYVGPNRPDMGSREPCVLLASAIFDRAQRQEDFRLPPFYAQEWKQGVDGSDGDFVRGLPADHVPAVWAARFLDGDATAKQFLEELNRLRFALGDGDDLLIGGVSSEGLDSPAFYSDGEGTITVHHSGKVSKVEFAHNRIVAHTPTTCKYYYDAEAIAEPVARSTVERLSQRTLAEQHGSLRVPFKTNGPMKAVGNTETHNRRTVWTIAPQRFPEAHFATFPEALVEPCIAAGSRAGDTVLDPICGSGTVGVVALRAGRDFIGIDLNPEYIEMARRRIEGTAPLFAGRVLRGGDRSPGCRA